MGHIVRFKKPAGRVQRPTYWPKQTFMKQWQILSAAPWGLIIFAAVFSGLAWQYFVAGIPYENSEIRSLGEIAFFNNCGTGERHNCVVDGDTIWYKGTKIRLVGIDAPEIHDYKCDSELARGKRAKSRLLELMNAGRFDIVSSGSRDHDVYGRKLRDIRRNGKSLGTTLVDEGLASVWEGRHHNWC
jgi:micrococcal nuclease